MLDGSQLAIFAVVNDASTSFEGFRRVRYETRGGAMAGIAFGAATPEPDIIFLHATGFNARTYRAMLQPLGERYHVVALDMRGHGRTELSASTLGYASWLRHRDDIVAVLERFSQPTTLAGHSMGATVALLVAGKRPDMVRSLALIEPVILSPSAYAVAQLPFGWAMRRWFVPLARNAARRRKKFPDRAAAEQAFSGRGVFKTFPQESIADYVGDGLVEDGRGGFKLACRPAYEAATFCAHRHDPWDALRQMEGPLVLLRGSRHSTISEASLHRVAAIKPEARVATVEGASHMLPIERPDRARAAIESAALMGGAGVLRRDAPGA